MFFYLLGFKKTAESEGDSRTEGKGKGGEREKGEGSREKGKIGDRMSISHCIHLLHGDCVEMLASV